MPSWIQDPKTGKLVPKDEYHQRKKSADFFVHAEFEEFVSPVDKTVIRSREQLRLHNKKHGVTDMRDYGPEWFKRKHRERSDELTGRSTQARRERINDIIRAYEQHNKR